MTEDAAAASAAHPLLAILLAAAAGSFPPADGGVTMLPALPGGTSAVVAFTAHAVVVTNRSPAELGPLGLDGYGGAMAPAALLSLACGSDIASHDVVLVARGTGGGRLPATARWDDHPRVAYARRIRSGVRVHGDERGLVTLGLGLADRPEMSVELDPARFDTGAGRALITEALALVDPGAPLFAAVAAGNARSLRAFLAAGFTPIASEVIIRPSPAG